MLRFQQVTLFQKFPVLYSRFSLVIYFMHSINSVYMSIPISQFIPPPLSPPWYPYQRLCSWCTHIIVPLDNQKLCCNYTDKQRIFWPHEIVQAQQLFFSNKLQYKAFIIELLEGVEEEDSADGSRAGYWKVEGMSSPAFFGDVAGSSPGFLLSHHISKHQQRPSQ